MSSTTTRTRPIDRPAPATRAAVAPPRHDGTPQVAAAFHDLAHLAAAPITNAAARHRLDRALAVLVGPTGADASHLLPTRRTADVVRHRIAAWALARLARDADDHHGPIARALDILRRPAPSD